MHKERTAKDEQQNKGQYQVLLKEVMGSFIIYWRACMNEDWSGPYKDVVFCYVKCRSWILKVILISVQHVELKQAPELPLLGL